MVAENHFVLYECYNVLHPSRSFGKAASNFHGIFLIQGFHLVLWLKPVGCLMCFAFCEVSALLRYLAKRHMRRGKNHQAAKQGASHRGVLLPTLSFLLSSPCFVLQGNKIFCLLSISLLVLCFGHFILREFQSLAPLISTLT